MTRKTDRRRFLREALGGTGAALWLTAGAPWRAALAQSGESSLGAVSIGDLVQVTGAGGNVLVLPGADGLLLVDSGAPERSAALEAFLSERFGGLPVQALFNTHWHVANTGGNEVFRRAGARILAHENTRLWMSTEFYVEWENKTYEPRAAEALPNDTFYSHEPQPLKLDFGNRQIEYGHLREAHTDGDIYVFFPEDNVIAAGGVVADRAYPVVDFTTGGWIGGMADATQKLLDLSDGETRFIPETGAVQTRADLVAQHEMLVTARERIADAMRKGKSVEEMLAEGVTRGFEGRWGDDPRLFVSNVYDGLWWAGRLSGSL